MRGGPFAALVTLVIVVTGAALLAQSQGQGLREIGFFNPLPYERITIAHVRLTFLEGEAYNGTLIITNAAGKPVPYQLNCSYYPSGYYRSCTVTFPVSLPALNYTRYLILYRSAPPAANISLATGLSVRAANLTVVAVNATGSYAINVTNGLVVRGPGYTAIFSNTSLLHLSFDDVGGNLVFADWPLAGFILLRNLSIAAGGYDLSQCSVKPLLNGSIIAAVEQTCRGKGFKLRQVFTFTSLSPLVRVDAALEGWTGGALYFPYLRVLSPQLRAVLVNGSEFGIDKERSFVPSPRWLALRGEGSWLVVAVNYTSTNLPAVLETQRTRLFRAYINETNPLRKAFYGKLLELYLNFSNLLLSSSRVAAAKANLTTLQRETVLFGRFPGESSALLSNLTSLLEAPENASRRLILIPQEGSLNVVYQIGEGGGAIRSTIFLAATRGEPSAFVRNILLNQLVEPAVFYSPIEARLDAPSHVYLDDFLTVSATIRAAAEVRNVTIKLVTPEYSLPIVEGKATVNFTRLTGEQRIKWVLRAMYEGSWQLMLNVTSAWGAQLVVNRVNVTLPPIVPRVVIPRSFNLSVLCVDVLGRPLSGYLVNLYENSTRRLIHSSFTNESGLVRFQNVSAGAYLLEVTDGLHSTWKTLLVYANRNFTVGVGLANLRVRVEMADGTPLSQAAVFVRDESGSLACAGFTDEAGIVTCASLPNGNYTVSVQWQGSPAGSTRVSLVNDTMITLKGVVRRTTVFVSIGNRPAAGATVTVYSATGTPVAVARTDERGLATFMLLPGSYRLVAAKGQYVSSTNLDTRVSQYAELKLALTPSLWVVMAVTAGLWLLTAYVWRRRTSYLYRERERYRRLLQRLEELHSRGEVEERFYVKLKQEYEAKLNELSRGEEA